MMKYLTRATAYGMISIFMSLSMVHVTYAASSNDELLLKQVQQEVKKVVRRGGNEEIGVLYEQVVYIRDHHKHPLVRQFMSQLAVWFETNYQANKKGRSEVPRKSVRGGAYLQPEVQVTTVTKPTIKQKDDQEEVTLAEIHDQEKEVYASPFTPQPKEKNTEDLEAKDATIDFQRYQLDGGYIDLERVQEVRLDWVNDLRTDRGLKKYNLATKLNKTAATRASTMRKKESADHKRFSYSSYYDYAQIENWFADAGVRFANDNRSTFTENVGYSYFTCDKGDCTEDAIDSLKNVFAYFISEEGKAYDLHRRTLIHPKYKIAGFGLSVDEENHFIYSAMHYGTELVEE